MAKSTWSAVRQVFVCLESALGSNWSNSRLLVSHTFDSSSHYASMDSNWSSSKEKLLLPSKIPVRPAFTSKIVVVGDDVCGKTSLLLRYCDGTFSKVRNIHACSHELYSYILHIGICPGCSRVQPSTCHTQPLGKDSSAWFLGYGFEWLS